MTDPSPSWVRRHRVALIVAGLLALSIVLWVLFAGRVLVRTDEPGNPQVVFSLSGDPLGDRLHAAAEVVKRTGAERLVVLATGPGGIYDWRADALAYLADEGIPHDIVRFMGPVRSTVDEARLAAGYAERCGWTEVAVATSPYHTRRAGWLFERAMGGDVTVSVVASDEPFEAGAWWRSSGSRELVLLEWVKGLSSAEYLVTRPDPVASEVPC